MRQFLRTVDSALAVSEAAEPTLADLAHDYQRARERHAAAENHLAAMTAELDAVEAEIATMVQAIGLRHHTIARGSK